MSRSVLRLAPAAESLRLNRRSPASASVSVIISAVDCASQLQSTQRFTAFFLPSSGQRGEQPQQGTPASFSLLTGRRRLAALGRSIAAQDPQRNPDAGGLAEADRNAELLLTAPFDLSTTAQTIASGTEGTGNATPYVVTLNFSFQDSWRYIATTSPCTVNLTYQIIAN